ncbi:MAG: RNA polymerase sigma factor RpoD/SigA [Ktedonobacteraceae bacterium]|nr:RNA polymerase sigma factor RpoD/SigA [Ktedonobacteraceae bacterium]
MPISRRDQFFTSLFDPEGMRMRYPHHDTALSAYLQELGTIPLLTPQQEAELLTKAIQGDPSASAHLVEANLRLVIAIAARFQGKGLAMLDLIQEGNLGLIEAIKRFDFSKAKRLSTYAKYWIVASISRAVTERGGSMHLPSYIGERMQKIQRVSSELLLQEREPTPERLAEHLGLPIDQVVEVLDLMQKPLSLQGGHDAISEHVAAPSLFLTTEITSPALLADVKQMISTILTPKQRLVIEARFGLNDEGIVYEYHEIAARFFHRTDERADSSIRQLEKSALARLRAAFDEQEA